MRSSAIAFAAFVALANLVSAAPIDIEARTDRYKPTYQVSGNKNNGFVFGSGNGGTISGAGASGKGSSWAGSAAGNAVFQGANGGDGSAVGSYGSGNTFHSRTYSKPQPGFTDNDNNGVVIGSGNGGSWNVAKPVAVSGAGASNKGWGGKVSAGSVAGNIVSQGGNGGDGSAVGSYGSWNHFNAREAEPEPGFPSFYNNDNNGVVVGSGNGGNGGVNVAKPVAGSAAVASGKGWSWSPVKAGSAAGNIVAQGGNGGDGSAVGSYGEHNHFNSRDVEERTYTQPKAPGFYDNDNNGVVIGSGNGGNGGFNIAKPAAGSVASASSKGWGWSPTKAGSAAGNVVLQGANGGDGSAVGSYGEHNHFNSRDVEERTYTQPKAPGFYNNDNNGVVIGSGNGGNGGFNIAKPAAGSVASASNKGWSWGSSSTAGSAAGNAVFQGANGGDGSAVGSYGSNNHFGRDVEERDVEERTYSQKPKLPVFSNNDNNGIVLFSGNGGNGGANVAVPLAVSAGGVKAGKVSTGDVSVSSGSGNIVGQGANGGDGSAVGSYGEHNWFGN
ncbi:hypothetical protein IAU60_005436 [Kwoniella sp. DSM 27419]